MVKVIMFRKQQLDCGTTWREFTNETLHIYL